MGNLNGGTTQNWTGVNGFADRCVHLSAIVPLRGYFQCKIAQRIEIVEFLPFDYKSEAICNRYTDFRPKPRGEGTRYRSQPNGFGDRLMPCIYPLVLSTHNVYTTRDGFEPSPLSLFLTECATSIHYLAILVRVMGIEPTYGAWPPSRFINPLRLPFSPYSRHTLNLGRKGQP